jgi:beta-lactamase class A
MKPLKCPIPLRQKRSSVRHRFRQIFLAIAIAGLGITAQPASAAEFSKVERQIQARFANLLERKALKIWSPPSTKRSGTLLVQLNAQQKLFTASANKVFILCERLRQLDSPSVEEELATNALILDQSVWSLGSPVFNPPDLSGTVNEQTAMEAMITHSDNTATDMILLQTGADRVRQFIASSLLFNTMIPDSTRALAGYLLGAPDYRTITWDELRSLIGRPFAFPALNNIETFSSSANDLVSFYERALQGKFFRNQQTLEQFRRIMSLGDITYIVPFPLGPNVFGKAGYFDSPGQHARCIAGGMYLSKPNRWVYFAAILNWDSPETDDPITVRIFFDALRGAIELVQGALGG